MKNHCAFCAFLWLPLVIHGETYRRFSWFMVQHASRDFLNRLRERLLPFPPPEHLTTKRSVRGQI
jgi:hypothetical protein